MDSNNQIQLLEARLQEDIERAIGRPVQNNGNGRLNIVNPELGPHNGYQWRFSRAYPEFPRMSLHQWSCQQLEECSTALDAGSLTVVTTEHDGPLTSSHKRNEVDDPANTPSHDSLADAILEISQRAKRLGHAHKNELAAAQAQVDRLHARVLELERKLTNALNFNETYLSEKLAIAKREVENSFADKIAQARSEGEEAGRDNAFEDWYAEKFALEKELRTLRRTAREEAQKARKEGFEEGVMAGRPEQAPRDISSMPRRDVRASTCAPTGYPTDPLPSMPESMPDRPRELHVGKLTTTDDHMSEASRKARATILEQWGGYPEQLLPSLCPPGHVMSEKTLRTLGTFSKAVDVETGIRLLTEANSARNKAQNSNVGDSRLRTGDVEKARRIAAAREAAIDTVVVDDNHASMNNSPPPVRRRSTVAGRFSQLVGQEQEQDKPYIGGLRSTDQISFPSPLEHFSSDFVRKYVGGNETTFATISKKKQDLQVVGWPIVMRINPKKHEWAPKLGEHGALTFVSGQDHYTIGKIYPAILRDNKDRFLYIGHYKVASRDSVPVKTWKRWPDEEREKIARDIRDKDWGSRLCISKGVELNGDGDNERMDEILEYFENDSSPNLRMSWTILELDHFDYNDYDALVQAWHRFSAEPTPEPSVGKRRAVENADIGIQPKRIKTGPMSSTRVELCSDSESEAQFSLKSRSEFGSKSYLDRGYAPYHSPYRSTSLASAGGQSGGPGPQTLASRSQYAHAAIPTGMLESSPPGSVKSDSEEEIGRIAQEGTRRTPEAEKFHREKAARMKLAAESVLRSNKRIDTAPKSAAAADLERCDSRCCQKRLIL